MRIVFTRFLFLLLSVIGYSGIANAQDSWLQKANFGGANREGATAFAIGDTGYIMTGVFNDSAFHDVWAWTPSTNTWVKKDTMIAVKRSGASATSMNGYGYLLCGLKPSGCFRAIGGGVCAGTFLSDVWQYAPSTDTWTNITTFPGAARNNAVVVANPADSTLYFGTGNDNGTSYLSDWWSYKVPTNTWAQLDSFPGGQRSAAVGFLSHGNIYVGSGDNNGKVNATSDFWEYNIAGNTWTKVSNNPVSRRLANVFVINDTAYVGRGEVGGSTVLNDLWMYDAVKDTWVAKTSYPPGGGYSAVGFSIGNNGYLGIGTIGTSDSSLFWEYTPGINDTTTGIAMLQSDDSSVKLFPNPNNGTFRFTYSGLASNCTLKITDVLGNTIDTRTFNTTSGEFEVNENSLSNGIYFYQLTNSGKSISTGKLIIVK
jgi:N-acetylneuraminic acid mutarotase